MTENYCPECDAEMESDKCFWCERDRNFRSFAQSLGLDFFPCPSGERYLKSVNPSGRGSKKVENIKFMDDLWDKLVEAHGRHDLKLSEDDDV